MLFFSTPRLLIADLAIQVGAKSAGLATKFKELLEMELPLLKETDARITSSEILANALREDFKAEKRECFGVFISARRIKQFTAKS